MIFQPVAIAHLDIHKTCLSEKRGGGECSPKAWVETSLAYATELLSFGLLYKELVGAVRKLLYRIFTCWPSTSICYAKESNSSSCTCIAGSSIHMVSLAKILAVTYLCNSYQLVVQELRQQTTDPEGAARGRGLFT